MTVREIMTKNPVFCTPETNLKEVAELMCEHDCGEIPVLDSEESMKPVGVVTDRDITCRTVAEGKNPLEMTADQCMTEPCVTVHPEMSLDECIQFLEENKIRRVPVVDEKGRCCGIVSQADIARTLSPEETGELVSEISRPGH